MNRPNRNFEVCAFHPPRIIPARITASPGQIVSLGCREWRGVVSPIVAPGHIKVAERADIMKHVVLKWCCLFTMLLAALPLCAQTPSTPTTTPSVSEKLSQLDQRVTAAQSSADNAWMLVSAA